METLIEDLERETIGPGDTSPDSRPAYSVRMVRVWVALIPFLTVTQIQADLPTEPADSELSSPTARLEVPVDSQETAESDDQSGSAADSTTDSAKEESPIQSKKAGQVTPSPLSKSGYHGIPTAAGPTSVEADLRADDEFKRPVFTFLQRAMAPLYDFKDRVNGTWGIAFGVDYNFLNQYASFSFTEKQATSGAFRVYGTWNMFHSKEKIDGRLVFRVENRHKIGGGVTPRDLGFDAGSALSTASFKDFAWGISALYWRQFFANRRFGFVFGQMDPGDFMDAYPLLSAWTAFMSDAFFNNPAEALPQQGVGFATRVFVTDHYYFGGGVHDALADADGVNIAELLDGEDLFYWVEVGWSPRPRVKAIPGDSIHLTYWQQDELEELGTEKSRGLAISVAPQIFDRYQPFLRVGYSDGDAALMRRIWALGVGIKYRESDLLGVATSWGAPVEPDTMTQWTSEIFYRIQLTDHLQVTPAVQVTRDPPFNPFKKTIFVGSVLRMRLAF